MTRSTLPVFCLTALLAVSPRAEEYSVVEKPFAKTTTLGGTFLPTESTAIGIAPEVWTDFTVTSLVGQGATVKKGETLIGIDTEKLDRYIAKAEKARKTDALKLAKAKHELAQLEISTPRSLESHARADKESAENLKWFTETGMPHEIEAAKRRVKSAELNLAYQMEELKQLEKMYAEDGKTEETEEIILTRTRNAVERARFALESARIGTAHTLETEIPRKLKGYQLAAENSRTANESAKESLPRALEIKRLEVAKAAKEDAEKAERLAKLKADRAMMEITAPADGVVYYGSMDGGRWEPASAAKVLKTGGKLPAHLPLLTLVPAESPLVISAFAKESALGGLRQGANGYAVTHLNPYRPLDVTLEKIATHPQTDGTYRVTAVPGKPGELRVVPGMKATVRVTAAKVERAIVVPSGYLTRAEGGSYTVKLKLADGKTEDRPVVIGVSNGDSVVVSKGLESGQVIVK